MRGLQTGCEKATDHIDELRELEAELDGQLLGVVGHRPDQPVVVVEQVIVEALRVRIGISKNN